MTARTAVRAAGTALGVAGATTTEAVVLSASGIAIAHSLTVFLPLWLAAVTAAGSLAAFGFLLYRLLDWTVR